MLDDIKKTLWATADKLRANIDAAEYKHLVLGLIFVKYVSDTFAARRAELEQRFTDKRTITTCTTAPLSCSKPSWKTVLLHRGQRVLGVGISPLEGNTCRRQAA